MRLCLRLIAISMISVAPVTDSSSIVHLGLPSNACIKAEANTLRSAYSNELFLPRVEIDSLFLGRSKNCPLVNRVHAIASLPLYVMYV